MTNPLRTYNAARDELNRLSGLLNAGVADWEVANPAPDNRFGNDMDRWFDAYDTAAQDIAADLDIDAARRRLVAAQHGLIGWMAVSVADAVNNHTEAAEIHRLFDLMNNDPDAAVRNRVRTRLLDVALRFARGRLRG